MCLIYGFASLHIWSFSVAPAHSSKAWYIVLTCECCINEIERLVRFLLELVKTADGNTAVISYYYHVANQNKYSTL